MFSAQVKKAEKPALGLFTAIAGVLAFVLLLAALLHVVNEQVEQARLRQAQYQAAQTAMKGCTASYTGTLRKQCIDQVNAGFVPYSAYTATIEMQARNQAAVAGDAVHASLVGH